MKIERNIPIPQISFGRQLSYPWPSMRPGDSILVPVSKAGKSGHRAARSFVEWRARNIRTDLRLICRTVAPGMVRIWMTTKEGRK